MKKLLGRNMARLPRAFSMARFVLTGFGSSVSTERERHASRLLGGTEPAFVRAIAASLELI